MAIRVVILAAGQGKRMHSILPKVLHPLAGKPLLEHVINTAETIAPGIMPIVVYGHQGNLLRVAIQENVHWIEQPEQLGTGHAVLQALSNISDLDQVVVLYGDVPLLSVETLKKLIETTPANGIGILTAMLDHPTGYGRIKRDKQQKIVGIIEEKDTTSEERAITEINTGIYYVPARYLKKWLPTLKNNNAQQEYYLTDIIRFAVAEKIPVHAVHPMITEEILGVNDRVQLSELERFVQHQQAKQLMQKGVTIYDPARLDIRGDVKIGRDVVLDVNVVLEGDITIGEGCVIGPNVLMRDVTLGDYVEVKANSVIEEAQIDAECVIGPFARIRPGTVLGTEVHIGNFVEIKNSKIKEKTKVNHLSYIGDSDIGKRVNVGAGTITCNYDGANKHKTTIGDDVHIGSDTQLVAPVKVGAGATIAAGSTITKDAPPHQLTLSHKLEQRSKKDWQRPTKSQVIEK